MWPTQSIQARDGSPASFTRLNSRPFWVTNAGIGAPSRHSCTQRYRPVRSVYCAEASVAASVLKAASAVRDSFIGRFLRETSACPGKVGTGFPNEDMRKTKELREITSDRAPRRAHAPAPAAR